VDIGRHLVRAVCRLPGVQTRRRSGVGILPIGTDWEVSPHWNSIFAVADCDATIERASTLGGSAIFVHTVPKAGRIGSLEDSGGALFAIRGPSLDHGRLRLSSGGGLPEREVPTSLNDGAVPPK
jgi:hypothetical protein